MPQTQRNLKYMVLNEISYSEKVTYCIITTILHFAKSKIICFLGGSEGEESACNVEDRFDTRDGKISWRREWLPTPIFLPGEF